MSTGNPGSAERPPGGGRIGSILSSARKWIDSSRSIDSANSNDRNIGRNCTSDADANIPPALTSEPQRNHETQPLSTTTPDAAKNLFVETLSPVKTPDQDVAEGSLANDDTMTPVASDETIRKQHWMHSLDDDTSDAWSELGSASKIAIEQKIDSLVGFASLTKILATAKRHIIKSAEGPTPISKNDLKKATSVALAIAEGTHMI